MCTAKANNKPPDEEKIIIAAATSQRTEDNNNGDTYPSASVRIMEAIARKKSNKV